MKFVLTIETGNAALTDDTTGGFLLAELIEQVAGQVREGYTSGYPRDPYSNGGSIGFWEYLPVTAGDHTGEDDE